MFGSGRAFLVRATRGAQLLIRRQPAFEGGCRWRSSSQQHASFWQQQELIVVWGGRAVGTAIAAGLIFATAPNASCKASQNDYRLSWDWKGLEEAIASEVKIECGEALKRLSGGSLDQAKISEAWQSIKAEQPKNSKLKLSELGLEGFSLVLAKLGMTDRETAVALFKLFDKDNSGAVDFDEWVIALNVMSSKDSAVKMRALFEFCDLNGDGKVTRKELGDSLSSLFHVVSKLTNGRFLRGETLQRMAITESEVASAVVEHALIDIFQDPYRDIKAGKDDLTFDQFAKWIQSDSASAKTFSQLFDLLGGQMVEANIEEVPWYEAQPERYGGYAFLVKRFVQLKKATRYLAYSSDVGEAFRPVVPPAMVNASYAVAVGYVCWDVYAYAKEEEKVEGGNVPRAVAHRATFQGVASIGLPFLIIHSAVHFAQKHFKRSAPQYLKWGPTVVGLILIPALPFVCDEPSEVVIEKAFEVAWPHHYPGGKPKHHLH